MTEEIQDDVRVIKRYANRKLYDTSRSSYVTLEDLAEMIRVGEDLQVIDNRTKEDLTSLTLAQIIFEQQKSRRRAMPLSALRTIIQGPAELFGRLSQPVNQLRDEAAKQVEKIKRRAEVIDEGRQAIIEALENMQRAIEETQHRIDERVRDAVDALTHVPNLKRELDDLRDRLVRLEGVTKRVADVVGVDVSEVSEDVED